MRSKSMDHFPVKLVSNMKVLDEQGCAYQSKKQAVVRTDTNEVLGVHGSMYRLVPNDLAFSSLDNAVRESGLDCTDMKISASYSKNCARYTVKYNFTGIKADVQVGDTVGFQIVGRNSYDGAWPFLVEAGALRLACKNGMVVSSVDNRYRKKHTKHTPSIDVNDILDAIAISVQEFQFQVKKWRKRAEIVISEGQATDIIRAFPDLNEELEKQLHKLYRDNADHLGNTLWAMENAMTEWATHTPIKESFAGNENVIEFNRMQRVRKALQAEPFAKLAQTSGSSARERVA